MFPPKKETILTIYAGYTVSIGVQLVVDEVWRYTLQNTEQLTVQLRRPDDSVVLTKIYTAADVDSEDKIITVTLDGEDTNLPEGRYYLAGVVNNYVIFKPIPVDIRKVVYHE